MFSRTTTTTWATPMPQLYQCSLVDLPCWEEVGRSQPSEWPLELHFVSLKVMVGYDNFSVWHLYTQAIPLHKLSEILCTFFLCIIFAGHHNHSQTLTVMHLWQDLKYAASQSTIRLLDRVCFMKSSEENQLSLQKDYFSISKRKLTNEMDLILYKAYQELQKWD